MAEKVIACVIARTVSKRLPLKILRAINPEHSMIGFLIERLKRVSSIDDIVICTSVESVDDILEDVAERHAVKIYRGSPDNVLERMLQVGKRENANILLRITGDNPFTSTEFIDEQIRFLRSENLDYVRVIDVPVGATAEVMKYNALEECSRSMDPSVSEYLMLFMFEPRKFKCGVIKPFPRDASNVSITVDTPNDLQRNKQILSAYVEDSLSLKLIDILRIIDEQDVPFSYIKPSGQIKLPYGKTVDFEEFLADMKRRITNSTYLQLYEN
jgi:Spore coat polysaccharide biosynthesis protein F, CMP-KDO synthetase homolog